MKHIVGLLCIVAMVLSSCTSGPSTTDSRLSDDVSAEATDGKESSDAPADGGLEGRIQIADPYFDQFGMRFEEISGLEDVFAVELICSVNKGVDLYAEVVEKETGGQVRSLLLEKEEGNNRHLWVLFPKTGEYVITIFAKEIDSTENVAYGTARLSVSAVVPTDKEYYLLTIADRNNPLIIEDGKPGEGSWYIFGGLSYTKYRTGKIAQPLVFTYRGAPVRLERGTDVTFLRRRDNSFIDTIRFTAGKDIPMKSGENRFVFAKDSEVFLSNGPDFYGTLAGPATFHTDTITSTAPEGSVVYVESGELYQIDVNGSGTISLHGKNFDCTNTISLFPYKKGERTDFYTASARELSIGSTTFTAPAGSYLSFEKDRLTYVIVSTETTVDENGKKTEVEADKLIRFREDGSIEAILTAK